ncbi:hypothetical protein BPAE_0062g00080 [Botrytis paeoniae]|uniref:Uncharacterized protein n=1 Tax=Botrytis paeoniae TaxID=278948 RepID=A0A4Z1FRQ3_9HELO|nr:hypothetical protein BPAE_0062g00080 [Botrytis paeoniae]
MLAFIIGNKEALTIHSTDPRGVTLSNCGGRESGSRGDGGRDRVGIRNNDFFVSGSQNPNGLFDKPRQ